MRKAVREGQRERENEREICEVSGIISDRNERYPHRWEREIEREKESESEREREIERETQLEGVYDPRITKTWQMAYQLVCYVHEYFQTKHF